MIEGVSRVFYEPELNRPVPKRRDATRFLREIPIKAVFRFLSATIRGVTTNDDSDVRLTAFLSKPYIIDRTLLGLEDYHHLCEGDFSMIIYPSEGEINQYVLNPETSFFSNAHQDSETVIVNGLKKIILNEEFKPKSLKFGKGSWGRSDFIFNYVDGGILLKKPIDKYKEFNDYLDYSEERL